MYPFVIIWKAEYLKEWFENRSYCYVENYDQIDNLIYKYIDEIIVEYEDHIKDEIKMNSFNLNRFYEMVNNESYCDFLFFSIKYFNISTKQWVEYDFDETKLNSYLRKYFNYVELKDTPCKKPYIKEKIIINFKS